MKTTGPLARPCPVCMSPAGVPCSQATNTGRRTVQWFHMKREEETMDSAEVLGEDEASALEEELSDEDREARDDLWDWLGGDY